MRKNKSEKYIATHNAGYNKSKSGSGHRSNAKEKKIKKTPSNNRESTDLTNNEIRSKQDTSIWSPRATEVRDTKIAIRSIPLSELDSLRFRREAMDSETEISKNLEMEE